MQIGGSNGATIALSYSLDISPLMHEDYRKNRGKYALLRIFCQNVFYEKNKNTGKIDIRQYIKCYSFINCCSWRNDIYKNHMRSKNKAFHLSYGGTRIFLSLFIKKWEPFEVNLLLFVIFT